ncbi:MAG TPA: STN domain-containing protein [Afipia sp.]
MLVKLSQKDKVFIALLLVGRSILFVRPFFALALFVGISLTNTRAWTEGNLAQPQGVIPFNIPSQPLATAIQAFSQESGIEVFYESNIATGRTSASVEGRYPPDAALQILLDGAGFKIRFTRRNAVVLSAPSARNDLPPTHALANFDLSLDTIRVNAASNRADEAQLREFGDVIQSEVETVLRKNSKIRSGNYRIRVKLWIDPLRTIRHAELAQSTGDRDRDTAITDVLQGFVVSRIPPPNTPQPIRVIVAVRSL